MPVHPDLVPAWMKPENASVVTDDTWTTIARAVAHLVGADSATGQVANVLAPLEVPGEAGGLAGLVQKYIKAYHGSPHDFEKFDLSKIGTGEGAQAYGHGLYFAENPTVAKEYKTALEGRRAGLGVGQKYGLPDKEAQEQIAKWQDYKKINPSEMHNFRADPPKTAEDRLRNDVIDGLYDGKTYEVAIHAQPEQFLDWDKPLSQQPRVVEWLKTSDAAPFGKQSIGWRSAPEGLWEKSLAQHTGEELYGNLRMQQEPTYRDATSWAASKGGASEALKTGGIPGIKYLDQGSRSAGEGTNNYVVFDDKLIEVLRKYGLLAPVAGGLLQQHGQDEAR